MSSEVKVKGNELFTEGYQFNFMVNGKAISAWGSCWTGKEVIKLDGSIVSEGRSYRRKSVHHFDIGQVPYEIEFNAVDILKGHLECTLIEDGAHVETQSIAYKHPETPKKVVVKELLLWMMIGLITGFLAARFLG
ncbi:hypothetical protein [Parashewanella tropica]|uniref:hypothetical protein n=1 Tax=Parashewanella tropica TaxID=2547970 RepID=UPI001059A1D9|nr:hypothetical protein [Parashewanella tropica]